ncbi:hypothetical protein FKP32DRAFT_1606950 [Trametes sanguinea]|nr:hypothetical protein FKP32DRAFT_1606950 [Trametes sanguinea]
MSSTTTTTSGSSASSSTTSSSSLSTTSSSVPPPTSLSTSTSISRSTSASSSSIPVSNTTSHSSSPSSSASSSSARRSSSVLISSSRPVLGPTATPSTTTVTGSTTLFTTVVEKTTFTTDGMTITSTFTTVVPTGTLIPNENTANGNIFAHDKGALAGLIVGVIAFVGLTAAWGLFAYRRHHVRRMQAEAAAAALGRSNGGNRTLVLDEDDDDDGHAAATRFVGSGPVSHPPGGSGGGGAVYDRLRGGSNLESPTGDEGGVSPIGDTRSQDDAGGGVGVVGLAPIPIVGMGEDASLMHPDNRSAADITLPMAIAASSDEDAEMGVLPPLRPPKSPTRSVASRPSSGPGPEPAAWLGGRVVSSSSLRNKAEFPTQPGSPTSPTSRSSMYSDEGSNLGHILGHPDAQMAAAAAAHGQPAMPSPALTEGSSVNAPEGLLDPRLALRLGAQGMQSQGALSFRDDQDYSRPIGGWVNNRQYSRTTIQTVSTRNESQRRPSLESHNTETTGVETVHPHAEGPHAPSAIEEYPSAS